jgi:hypothetical protein
MIAESETPIGIDINRRLRGITKEIAKFWCARKDAIFKKFGTYLATMANRKVTTYIFRKTSLF